MLKKMPPPRVSSQIPPSGRQPMLCTLRPEERLCGCQYAWPGDQVM